MAKFLNATVFSLTALAALSATSASAGFGGPSEPPSSYLTSLLDEHLVGPVAHSPVEDQGDVGFCWAYALSGMMEGNLLHRDGTAVTLSPEYLALNNMVAMVQASLPIFAQLDHGGLMNWMLKRLIAGVFNPEGSVNLTQALDMLSIYGTMPSSAFNYKFPYSVDSHGNLHEIHPTLQEKLEAFSKSNLLDKAKVAQYQANPAQLRSELLTALGVTVPEPTATFSYKGKSYTPMTFMQNYMGFNPGDYKEVAILSGKYNADPLNPDTKDMPVLGYSHEQGLQIMRKALSDGASVPIAFLVLNDMPVVKQDGVFSPENCPHDRCTGVDGGHAVLTVGIKDNSTAAGDPIDALLIKNSWGTDLGLDDTAKPIAAGAHNGGFFLITSDYLQVAENQQNSNGWSFVVAKKYLGK